MVTDCRLVIVRRGHFATFELLIRTFASDPDVQIVWDRRVEERRCPAEAAEHGERRRLDRRKRPPKQWSQLNYMLGMNESYVGVN